MSSTIENSIEVADHLLYIKDDVTYQGIVIYIERIFTSELSDRGVIVRNKNTYRVMEKNSHSIVEITPNSDITIVEVIKKEKYLF